MKYLIIGLGNPGEKYLNTRHNIGFKVLDELSSSLKSTFSLDRYAEISIGTYKSRRMILVKPSTFMNLSGKAVNYWMQKEKISIERLLVISDDIAIPYGNIRMRAKGSDGGHNGLKDIIQTLASSSFSRIRIGIGSEFSAGNQSDYVLGKWTSSELESLDPKIERTIKMVQSFCTRGLTRTMNDFNRKK